MTQAQWLEKFAERARKALYVIDSIGKGQVLVFDSIQTPGMVLTDRERVERVRVPVTGVSFEFIEFVARQLGNPLTELPDKGHASKAGYLDLGLPEQHGVKYYALYQ